MFMRLSYAASHVKKSSSGKFMFLGRYDEVHLDEKWFFMCRKTQKVYISKEEAKASNGRQKG
jgi:hypothetical protein